MKHIILLTAAIGLNSATISAQADLIDPGPPPPHPGSPPDFVPSPPPADPLPEAASAEVETRYHPADLDRDWAISIAELTAFGANWRSGQALAAAPEASIGALTRAGYLWRSGGRYRDAGEGDAGPQRWVPER